MTIKYKLASILLFMSINLYETKLYAKSWGLGITLIDVTGFSAKKILSSQNNADFNLGWETHDDELKLILSAHYNWVYRAYIRIETVSLDAYLGLGIKIPGDGHGTELRAPLGVSYFFGRRKNFEAFASIIPGMAIYPSTALKLSMALGGRYFF